MISSTYRMVRKSQRIRARCDEPEKNGNAPPPAPVNWQEMLAAMEARMLCAEEEVRMYIR